MISGDYARKIRELCKMVSQQCRDKAVTNLNEEERFSLAVIAGCKICIFPGNSDDNFQLKCVNMVEFVKTEKGFMLIEQIGNTKKAHHLMI